ncbi:MAG: hypothetical protein JOZ90_01250 [Alphaproteobacteria bacterium]|nr:hypothetical protein [Alphaproteobacteria bacterium]MBV9370219.1 hypothetical protein [Alphaproteobacteria bacterium]MBV9899704.1 hypothetical protein [Alphaproteobacteria bacterium]
MAEADPLRSLEAAFDGIEGTILPSLSVMLDTLLEAASLARPGHDADVYAAELRTIGYQLEALTREVEAASPARVEVQPPRRASAA